jgi:hypothetical protein
MATEKQDKKRAKMKRPPVGSKNPLGGLAITATVRRKAKAPVQGVKKGKK